MKKLVTLILLSVFLTACSEMQIVIPGVVKPIFEDEFVMGHTGDWLLESDETGSTMIVPEQLLIEVKEPHLVQYATLTEPTFSDFLLEVDGRILSGSPHSSYGVLFRIQGPQQFYRYEITGDGTYILERHDADGSRVLFMGDWRDSDAIAQGTNVVNKLGIEAKGSKISLFVNEEFLQEVTDSTYSEGNIALDAGAFALAPVHVSFDNVLITSPN